MLSVFKFYHKLFYWLLHSELMRYYLNCWGAIFDSYRKVGMIKITIPFHPEQTQIKRVKKTLKMLKLQKLIFK